MSKNKRTPEAIAGDLFPALELFGKTFTVNGELPKRFNAVQDILLELREADPRYQLEFGATRPFGVEIKSEMMRFLVTVYLGGRWLPDSTMDAVVERLFSQAAIQGNPLNRD